MYKATFYRLFATAALFTGIFLSPLPPSASAQQVAFRSAEDGTVAMMAIPGGLVVVEGEKEARVARKISTGDADAPDFKEGDLIIFLNGTRIESTDQFNTLFEAIEVDSEVKVGIQRGENKMIRSFIKPPMQNSYASNEGGRVMRMELSGPGDTIEGLENRGMWPAGFIVGEKAGTVVVGATIPIPNKAKALEDIEAGDAIVSLDGQQIKSVEQLNKLYGEIEVGDDVKVTFQRDGTAQKVMFKKPDPPQMRMRIENN